MKLFRTVLFCVVALALTGGYIASQVAYLGGQFKDYAAAVDTPLIQGASLLVLLLCIVMPFLKGSSNETDEEESP
jgi:hypothetical protein